MTKWLSCILAALILLLPAACAQGDDSALLEKIVQDAWKDYADEHAMTVTDVRIIIEGSQYIMKEMKTFGVPERGIILNLRTEDISLIGVYDAQGNRILLENIDTVYQQEAYYQTLSGSDFAGDPEGYQQMLRDRLYFMCLKSDLAVVDTILDGSTSIFGPLEFSDECSADSLRHEITPETANRLIPHRENAGIRRLRWGDNRTTIEFLEGEPVSSDSASLRYDDIRYFGQDAFVIYELTGGRLSEANVFLHDSHDVFVDAYKYSKVLTRMLGQIYGSAISESLSWHSAEAEETALRLFGNLDSNSYVAKSVENGLASYIFRFRNAHGWASVMMSQLSSGGPIFTFVNHSPLD